MEITFRPYQKEAIHDTIKSFATYRRVLLVSPTGSGKTVMAGGILSRFIENTGKKVLVLMHGDELIEQWAESAYQMFGVRSGIIKSGRRPALRHMLQVASVQSAVRRDPVDDVGLVIVDECHRSKANSYQKLMDKYPNAFILGITATPVRSDGQGFGDTFDHLIVAATKPQLIEQGFLVPFKLFVTPLNTNMLRNVGMRGRDYDEHSLGEMMQDETIMANALNAWKTNAEGLQTICFCSSVAHAQAVATMFSDAGVSAAMVCGATPEWERKDIVRRFREGKIDYLTNVGVFTEGFDVKSIECVHLLRATKSYSLFSQMIGRGGRTYPGKTECILIDQGNNWIEHGLPNDEPNWSLSKGTKKKKQEEEAEDVVMIKMKDTEEIVVAYRHELPLFTDDLEVMEADLTFRKDRIDACFKYAESMGYKASHAFYNFKGALERKGDMPTIPELHYFKNRLNYDPYWVKIQAREMGVKTL